MLIILKILWVNKKQGIELFPKKREKSMNNSIFKYLGQLYIKYRKNYSDTVIKGWLHTNLSTWAIKNLKGSHSL